MPARMVGAPVQMVYATRNSDLPPKGFPTYEDTPESFRRKRNGILPGYAGHLPNARDKIGASPIGGVPVWTEEGVTLGQPVRYTTKQEPPREQVSFMSKDLEKRHVIQRKDYTERVNGIVPGYAGFVPGANHTYGASPFGGVPVTSLESQKQP